MEEANYAEQVTPTQPTVEEKRGIELSDNERAFIEAQRQENAKLENFRQGYQKLVEETGFAWVVDAQSPIGAPKLGITKVN